MTSRRQLISETAGWITKTQWNYFVTLTFKGEITDANALYQFTGFVKRMNYQIFGKRSKRRIPMFPVIEHTKCGNPHFHLMVGNNDDFIGDKLKLLIMDTWSRSSFVDRYHMMRTNDWFQPIETSTESKAVRYCLKTARNDIDCVILDHVTI